ncbi:MAG: glycine dehydrogenase (aminomethyl-transferring), partial [Chitinophagaceae bacterium]
MNIFAQQAREFYRRHIGTLGQEKQLLSVIGVKTLQALIEQTVPASIRRSDLPELPEAISEAELLQHLTEVSQMNQGFRTYIGQGYYDTHTPSVILRNIFENPGWYTQYIPDQAEIAQGQLESLLNF